jgi:hypothetical protein
MGHGLGNKGIQKKAAVLVAHHFPTISQILDKPQTGTFAS